MELKEKALDYLKSLGLTTEVLNDLNEGNKEKANKATDSYAAKIKERSREEIKADLESEHRKEIEDAKKEAQTGSYKAAKNKLLDFAKRQGYTVAKSDVESLDFNDTLSLINDKMAEAKDKGGEGDKGAEIQHLRAQIEELNKQNTEFKAAIENHPKQLEAHAKKVLDDVFIEHSLTSAFDSYKDKTQKFIFENPVTKKGLQSQFSEYLKSKGVIFVPEETNGKKTIIPKKQQVDRNGKPIEGSFVPLEQTATTNHSLESLTQEFFETNNLIVKQGESTAQPITTNTQASSQNNGYDPYKVRVE